MPKLDKGSSGEKCIDQTQKKNPKKYGGKLKLFIYTKNKEKYMRKFINVF